MSALALAEICRSTGCAIAREAALPRLFVHISAFAGISGMLSPNILVLRAMSILSSASAMAFNLGKWAVVACNLELDLHHGQYGTVSAITEREEQFRDPGRERATPI